MKTQFKKRKVQQRGFTLFIAALVSSVLLSLAIYMAGIAQKELLLTNLARESQYAFYAADAGAECSLYLDFQGRYEPGTGQTAIQCGGVLLTNLADSTSTGTYSTALTTSASTPSVRLQYQQAGRCIIMHVYKLDVSPTDGILDANGTIIDSRGYNTACSLTNSPRRLERAVRLQY
jgi:Tfp pilus assembly protein PilX